MSEAPDTETFEIGELDFDEWNEYALAHGWGDGFPLMVPTVQCAVCNVTNAWTLSKDVFMRVTYKLTFRTTVRYVQ